MDDIALQILEESLRKDSLVLSQAAAAARARMHEASGGYLAAAGYEINRAYNILEKAFERVCETFENHFEKRGNYHEKLIERMELPLGGIRPAFLPSDAETLRRVRHLKGFRHIFRHAYDLELDPDRLETVVRHSECVAETFPGWCAEFLHRCRTMHSLKGGEQGSG